MNQHHRARRRMPKPTNTVRVIAAPKQFDITNHRLTRLTTADRAREMGGVIAFRETMRAFFRKGKRR